MKILSRFKDYYDYLAHQYGIDENVIFKRDSAHFTSDNVLNTIAIDFVLDYVAIPFTRNFWSPAKPYHTDILVVNGKGYIIYGKNGFRFDHDKTSKVYFAGQDIDLDKQLKASKGCFIIGSRNYVAFDIPNIDTLTKLVGSPVFVITHYIDTTVSIAKKAPNLGELGFAKYKDAYTMYQETACYIGKVFGSVEPPIQISDKDRIVAHGFDLKTSFRGKQ
jgi:hypothetical protein